MAGWQLQTLVTAQGICFHSVMEPINCRFAWTCGQHCMHSGLPGRESLTVDVMCGISVRYSHTGACTRDRTRRLHHTCSCKQGLGVVRSWILYRYKFIVSLTTWNSFQDVEGAGTSLGQLQELLSRQHQQ